MTRRSIKPSGFYNFTVSANASYQLDVAGDYFVILSSTGALNFKADYFDLRGLTAGQGLEDTPFSRLQISDASGAANTVRLFIGDEKFVTGMGGSVIVSDTIVPRSGAFVNLQKTVTNASAQILAANPLREYLLVQNKDLTGSIWIGFGAGAVTQANGVRIGPGGFYELVGVATTQEIRAIGDLASNANITTVEG